MTGGTTVQTVSFDLVLLRTALSDAVLRPGLRMFGRVTERVGDHGLLLLNGNPVVAKLPPGVDAGARLRLQVTETTQDRVVLAILPEAAQGAPATAQAAPAAQQPTAPPIAFALPGGMQAHLQIEPDAGGEGGEAGARARRTVRLRLDSPELGRLDLLLNRHACAIHVPAGPPYDAARAAAPELAAALAGAVGHPVHVTVHPRRQTLDVSA